VNSLPKTVTRQRSGCDLNPGLSVPKPSTLTQSCPWVGLTHGLGWVGLGRDFSVFGGLGWVHYRKSTKNLKGLC